MRRKPIGIPRLRGVRLRAEGLSKSYGVTRALRDASVSVAPGEVVAIEGPSGGGKSTMLRLLAGIEVPDAGAVWFDDVELSSMRDDARARLRRSAFGVVLQFGSLVPDLSLRDNVALPLLLGGVAGREARRRAGDLLEEVGVAAQARKLPSQVSGGEGQRAAVARALVHEPAVVLADEPTGALDTANSEKVLEMLLAGARRRGACVVVVTHDEEVASRADRRVSIIDGATTRDPTG